MDFIVEFVFQIVFELVVQVLVELGLRGASQVLGSRLGRASVGTAVGLGFGLWWGDHLSDSFLVHRPRLLWVSLILAGLALARALMMRSRPAMNPIERLGRGPELLLDPRRWPRERLLGFAALNLAIAVGIELAFSPHIPG